MFIPSSLDVAHYQILLGRLYQREEIHTTSGLTVPTPLSELSEHAATSVYFLTQGVFICDCHSSINP